MNLLARLAERKILHLLVVQRTPHPLAGRKIPHLLAEQKTPHLLVGLRINKSEGYAFRK